MRVCQVNDCKNPATFEVIPLEMPNGFLKDIWICDDCNPFAIVERKEEKINVKMS